METRAAISGTEPTEADESSTNRPCHRSFRGPLILVGRGLVNGSGACLAVEAEFSDGVRFLVGGWSFVNKYTLHCANYFSAALLSSLSFIRDNN